MHEKMLAGSVCIILSGIASDYTIVDADKNITLKVAESVADEGVTGCISLMINSCIEKQSSEVVAEITEGKKPPKKDICSKMSDISNC